MHHHRSQAGMWILLPLVLLPIFSKSQNIITNGDFETWPIAATWTTIGTGITATQEMAILQGGLSSSQIDINTTTQALTDFRQSVSVTAGVIYDVSVWIYHSDNQARARLYCDGFTNLYSDENISGIWQQLTYTYTAAATGPIEIGLRFYDVAGNWVAAPSSMYIDDFIMAAQAGIVANQFEFLYSPPTNAGLGLAFDITVCATDGTNTDAGYATPVALNDNGSTATYTISPTSPAAPVSGCITYTITPATIGDVNLDFGNADFPSIQTGNIPVTVLAIPTISVSAEIPDTDPNGATNSDALNDTWENTMGAPCLISYQTVYGSLSYNNTTHVGSINGLVQVTAGPSSAPYVGSASYRLVNMNGPRKGTHFLNGDGTLSANTTSLQANAPKPTAVANDLHFTENTGNLNARNAFQFTFAPAISDFGLWVGDVETNPFGTSAEVVLFNGDAELTRLAIPTSSNLADQQNTGGTGCGSSSSFPGCGNHTTMWISFTGGDVTDMLVIVGDDDVGGAGLTEHLSFAGPTTGGDCDQVVLHAEQIQLAGVSTAEGNQLSWEVPISMQLTNLQLLHRTDGSRFTPVNSDARDLLAQTDFLDRFPAYGKNYYRLLGTDNQENVLISNTILIRHLSKDASVFRIYPNPVHDVLTYTFVSEFDQIALWEVYDHTGKQVISQSLHFAIGRNEGQLEIHALPAGMYFYRLDNKQVPSRGSFSKY